MNHRDDSSVSSVRLLNHTRMKYEKRPCVFVVLIVSYLVNCYTFYKENHLLEIYIIITQ